MPHSGPRGSPLTDLRYWLTPAIATAADTMAPAGTVTAAPSTESVTESAMRLQMSTPKRELQDTVTDATGMWGELATCGTLVIRHPRAARFSRSGLCIYSGAGYLVRSRLSSRLDPLETGSAARIGCPTMGPRHHCFPRASLACPVDLQPCASCLRPGKYGSTGIAGVRRKIWSATSFPVAIDVVIPSPS